MHWACQWRQGARVPYKEQRCGHTVRETTSNKFILRCRLPYATGMILCGSNNSTLTTVSSCLGTLECAHDMKYTTHAHLRVPLVAGNTPNAPQNLYRPLVTVGPGVWCDTRHGIFAERYCYGAVVRLCQGDLTYWKRIGEFVGDGLMSASEPCNPA